MVDTLNYLCGKAHSILNRHRNIKVHGNLIVHWLECCDDTDRYKTTRELEEIDSLRFKPLGLSLASRESGWS